MTLQVGQAQMPVDLPLDLRIANVVGGLVAHYVPTPSDPQDADPHRWHLGTTWGRPFGSDTSLGENGIVDGSVLVLATERHWAGQEAGENPGASGTGPSSSDWASHVPRWAEQSPGGTQAPSGEARPVGAQRAPGSQGREEEIPTPTQPSPAPEEESPARGVESKEWTLPQERSRSRLPDKPPVRERLRAVAKAVVRPDDDLVQSEQGAEVPAPGRPISPLLLSHDQVPDALARARLAWREGSYRWKLERAIAQPQLRRCVTIAVISPKGGVGKTTVTALLGTFLSLIRRDRIVAVDANRDFGSLGRVLTANHHVYVDDLAEVLDDPQLTVTALDQNLGRTAHGLMVLPAPIDPARMEWLDEATYARVIERLRQMVGVVLLDCGTGLHDPASKAAIRAADQVVLVADPDPTTASLVAGAAGLLNQRGARIWLVANKVPRRGGRLDLQAFGSYVSFAQGLVTVPLEPEGVHHLTDGSFDWDHAPSALRRSVAELATDLIAAWPELGVC